MDYILPPPYEWQAIQRYCIPEGICVGPIGTPMMLIPTRGI